MRVTHHPDEALVSGYAAGTLDQGQHVAVATHLASCADCRRWSKALERVGGQLLEDLPPATLSAESFQNVLSRLAVPAPTATTGEPAPGAMPNLPGLPGFVQRMEWGNWRFVAPGLRLRPLALPHEEATRVFLLKAAPGTRLLQHDHTGIEMTCVLTGSYRHADGEYRPGDFDLGDATISHKIEIGGEAECICLVAMQGNLKLSGLLGKLVQPLVRM